MLYIYPADRQTIAAGVLEMAGKEISTDSYFIAASLADVGGYIGESIVDDATGTELPHIDSLLVSGVLVPMTAAKATRGMTSVSMMAEGGSSVTIRENVSGDVKAYRQTLLRYRRALSPGGTHNEFPA